MPSKFLAGLTGGAAVNNVNVLLWVTGPAHARHTDRDAGAFAARDLLSRRTTGIDAPTVCSPYTLKTS